MVSSLTDITDLRHQPSAMCHHAGGKTTSRCMQRISNEKLRDDQIANGERSQRRSILQRVKN